MTLLDMVHSPADVKKMSVQQLNDLAQEIRQGILKRDSLIGGHVGPNLGFVEATLALHYVFNSPVDKIVFDVSHQCYAHKMITGRYNGFFNPDDYDKITGYTNPHESEHDHFVIGHTSTSVSLASGLAKARDLKGEKHNVIAVIGDGSLSGGEALEGLDFAASELGSNFIVVVNDNQMSIAENHGGLYNNLKLLRETNGQAEINFFEMMRQILSYNSFVMENTSYMTAKEILEIATLKGAEMLGENGEVKEKNKANFLIVKRDERYINPFNEIVFGKNNNDILFTIKNGKILQENGVFVMENGENYDKITLGSKLK